MKSKIHLLASVAFFNFKIIYYFLPTASCFCLLPTLSLAQPGSLDTTFSSDGKVTTAIGSSDDVGMSVVLQSDSKIIVAGISNNGANDDFAVARYNNVVTIGIAEYTEQFNGSIYPTPTTGKFTVQSSDFKVQSLEIYNVLGEKVYSASPFPLGRAGDGLIDLSSHPNGIYFVKLQTDNNLFTQKIIINK